jgi:hypothetical protein
MRAFGTGRAKNRAPFMPALRVNRANMKLSNKDLDHIESEIGMSLPIDVRDRYLKENGFVGPTNVQLLFGYRIDPSADIVDFNKFLQSEEWLPESLRELVVVGIDGVGGNIGYDHRIQKGVLWYPVEGEHYDLVADSVSEVWEAVIRSYEENS